MPIQRNQPLVIGIAGGSGSGKTTVATNLRDGLPAERCVLIEHDWYYLDRSHLSPEDRAAINYDHPKALESSLLAHHLEELRAGRSVEVPDYDFVNHARRRGPDGEFVGQRVDPAPVIIVEGILVLVDPLVRDQLDIKIFVDTDVDIRLLRRIRRDLEQRGRPFASIRDQYNDYVRPMHIEFVEPSKRLADLIVPEGGENRVALEILLARLDPVVAPH